MRNTLVVGLAIALLAPAIDAQGRFLTVGGGASFPAGSAKDMMDPGWVTEVMAGAVLPGGFSSVRIGGMFGQARIGSAMGEMSPVEPGTHRMLGLMGGVMAMPRWDYDWMPYVFASMGGINTRYQGSTNSFAWASGIGTTLKWKVLDFYTEGRYLQARKHGDSGEMLSITAGLRFTR